VEVEGSALKRRAFLAASAGAAFARTAGGRVVADETRPGAESDAPAGRIRFAAIGLNHAHIHNQVSALEGGGGQLVSFFAREPDLADAFARRYPQARRARSEREILDDPQVALVTSASIPDERAPLGIEAMRAGKDFLVDKPGAVTLEQLEEVRRVQAETRRIYSILYGERLENRATVKALALVRDGAIGRVVQTIGLGPHRVKTAPRPPWFWDRARYGGILCDVGSHQVDQFLALTGSTRAEVVASQAGNVAHPDHPGFEDFGDAMLSGDGGAGYLRLDWLTPDGLGTWGDGRLTVLGTEGTIEVRKYVDLAGRPGGDHLFLVGQQQTRYFDCRAEPLPFGAALVRDVLDRTETAMPQAHCFLATELALRAQVQARRVGPAAVASLPCAAARRPHPSE
jgi:predicted dehydrogenase